MDMLHRVPALASADSSAWLDVAEALWWVAFRERRPQGLAAHPTPPWPELAITVWGMLGRQAATDQAVRELSGAARDGRLQAFGRPAARDAEPSVSDEHEAIDRKVFLEPGPLVVGGWLRDGHVVCLRFRAEEAIALWPPSEAKPNATRWSVETEADLTADAARREWRQRRIEAIALRLRQQRRWVAFADIADWLAREEGSILADTRRRDEAFEQLRLALRRGEFETAGRSQVLFLHPDSWGSPRLTREKCDFVDGVLDAAQFASVYLANFWIPADLADAWFGRRRLPRPAHLFPAASDISPANTSPARIQAGVVEELLRADREGELRAAAEAAALPEQVRPGRLNRHHQSANDRIITALLELHRSGAVEIRQHHRGSLHAMALEKAGIGSREPGSGLSTFERALSTAVRRLDIG